MGGLVERQSIFSRWGWAIKGEGNFEYGKKNLEHKICFHKFAISHEETGLRLTFSFTFFPIIALHSFFLHKQNAYKRKMKIIQKLDETKTVPYCSW